MVPRDPARVNPKDRLSEGLGAGRGQARGHAERRGEGTARPGDMSGYGSGHGGRVAVAGSRPSEARARLWGTGGADAAWKSGLCRRGGGERGALPGVRGALTLLPGIRAVLGGAGAPAEGSARAPNPRAPHP